MYYEFYLDIYFLENLMMNCLVLYTAGSVRQKKPRLPRILLAGGLGALSACTAVVWPIHKNALLSVLYSLAACPLMAAAGYGRRGLWQMTLEIMGLSLLLGGTWYLLRVTLSLPFWAAIPAGYLLVNLCWRIRRRLKVRARYIYDVVLCRQSKKVCLKGLLDSGNRLFQPGTTRPVHIVDFAQIKTLLSEEEARELTGLLNLQPVQEISGKFTYIPYHSIGNSEGVLPAFALDSICIKQGENAWSTKGDLVAVSKEAVSERGEYQMILHPRILE